MTRGVTVARVVGSRDNIPMLVRCPMFGDQIVSASLVEVPGESRLVLEIAAAIPTRLEAPHAQGTLVVEATPEEWKRLRSNGYKLPWA